MGGQKNILRACGTCIQVNCEVMNVAEKQTTKGNTMPLFRSSSGSVMIRGEYALSSGLSGVVGLDGIIARATIEKLDKMDEVREEQSERLACELAIILGIKLRNGGRELDDKDGIALFRRCKNAVDSYISTLGFKVTSMDGKEC